MPRTSSRILKENAIKALDYIQETSSRNRDHLAPLSYRQIAEHLGLTVQQVRFLCTRLEQYGAIVSCQRFAPDGGQLANGYALTSRGRMVLREVRKVEAIV